MQHLHPGSAAPAAMLHVHLAATLEVHLAAEHCALVWPHRPFKRCNMSTDVLMSCPSQAFRWLHLHAVVPAGWMRTALCCSQVVCCWRRLGC